jgi:hypothetical protein
MMNRSSPVISIVERDFGSNGRSYRLRLLKVNLKKKLAIVTNKIFKKTLN